jgi:hypothetical protein
LDIEEAFENLTATGTKTSTDLDTAARQEFPMKSDGL